MRKDLELIDFSNTRSRVALPRVSYLLSSISEYGETEKQN